MSLFNFHTDHVTLTKEISGLKPFQKLLEREDSNQVLLYIYHLADWKSNYAKWDPEERREKLIEEVLDGEEPDEEVEEAVEFYKELNQTESLKLLEAARKGVYTLQEYFEQEDPMMEEKPGKAAKDLISNLEKVGNILKALNEWEEQIKQEQDQNEIRKGVELNEFNKG